MSPRAVLASVSGAWSRFWFAERDGLPLAVARIGFAAASLCFWCGMLPWLRTYYSDAGEFPIGSARVWGTEWFGRFLMPDALGSLPVVVALAALWGLALVALLFGWRTRAAALTGWLLTFWFHHRNPTFLNGGDEMLRLASLYLAAAFLAVPPAQRALSVDRARALRAGRATGDLAGPTAVPSWTVRMIQLQLCVLYVVSGFWKVIDPTWQDGTALWVALASPTFTRFGAPAWVPQPLFALGTLTVSWWELLFPVLVALRWTRCAALAFGVLVHLFILVFMNVGVFPVAMLGLYPAFLTPAEGRAALAALGVPFRAASPQPSTSARSTGTASAALP
jgi:hypothetical protein